MAQRTFSVTLAGLVLLLLLVGCSLRKPLTYHAVEYNRVVEVAHNRTLLLNIVRAMKRRPMHFTAIGNITAELSYTASGGSLSFGETDTTGDTTGNSETSSLALPSLSVTANPAATVAVLDTQEFVRGTLAQVEAKTVGYYLSQGWKTDLLAYLVVERVELSSDLAEAFDPKLAEDVACGRTRAHPEVLYNDPENTKRFDRFKDFVHFLNGYDCHLKETSTPVTVGRRKDEPTYENLIQAKQAGLGIRKADDKDKKQGGAYEIYQTKSDLELSCVPKQEDLGSQPTRQPPTTGPPHLVGRFGEPEDAAQPSPPRARSEPEGTQQPSQQAREKSGTTPPVKPLSFYMTLRSPQGVLYYLGEVTRVWDKAATFDRIPMILVETEEAPTGAHTCKTKTETRFCVPLFLARKPSSDCRQSQVLVKDEGDTFIIPKPSDDARACENKCCPGRSLQALTLASQLLGLQKKGESLPGVSLVRSIGQ